MILFTASAATLTGLMVIRHQFLMVPEQVARLEGDTTVVHGFNLIASLVMVILGTTVVLLRLLRLFG